MIVARIDSVKCVHHNIINSLQHELQHTYLNNNHATKKCNLNYMPSTKILPALGICVSHNDMTFIIVTVVRYVLDAMHNVLIT